MTEQEWSSSCDPQTMLQYVISHCRSDRKLRLFACGCCRQVWNQIQDKHSRNAVQCGEALADNIYENPEVMRAQFHDTDNGIYIAARSCCFGDSYESAYWTSRRLTDEYSLPRHNNRVMLDFPTQADILRDIIGNPIMPVLFRHPCMACSGEGCSGNVGSYNDVMRCGGEGYLLLPKIPTEWSSWNDATIPRIAQQIYDTHSFQDMPILADALEDAGCINTRILEHCRTENAIHVRGCWLLDLILEKE